jgi:hypothetical protein
MGNPHAQSLYVEALSVDTFVERAKVPAAWSDVSPVVVLKKTWIRIHLASNSVNKVLLGLSIGHGHVDAGFDGLLASL